MRRRGDECVDTLDDGIPIGQRSPARRHPAAATARCYLTLSGSP
ncbi:hypothetical protein C7S13_6095 [Burkholderia cepacia]|nr:hypothetical protein [Burkholderia cepacia]